MNLPILPGIRKFVGKQAGGYQHFSDLVCNCKMEEWLVQGKAILGLKVIHTLCHLVKTSENPSSVGEWKNRGKSWERKGPQLYLRQQNQFKVLYPYLALSHAHCCSPGRSFSSVQFWAMKVNMYLFYFILMHRSESFISPRADSESRLHMPAIRTGKWLKSYHKHIRAQSQQ